MKKTLIVLLALILTACSAGGSELSRNQQEWEDANISHYQFELTLSCFCGFNGQMPLTIEVKDGEAVALAYADGRVVEAGDPLHEFFNRFTTIDRLFAELKSAMSSADAGDITVQYDESFGFPAKASIDYIKEAVDDELYITVAGFEKLP